LSTIKAAQSQLKDAPIVDITPPQLMVPNDSILEASASYGKVVTYKAIATDLVDGTLNAICNPPSNSTFSLGDTKVTCKAEDNSGNIVTRSFTIRVQDNTPPETRIDSASAGILGNIKHSTNTSSDRIKLKLSAFDNVGIDHFECKLDEHKWVILEKENLKIGDDCIYVDLPSGSHTVLVRSVDKSDNVDPKPARFSWSVPTIHESISNIIKEVKELSFPSYLSRNMIDSLNKIFEELNAEDLTQDSQICRQIESFLSATREATLNEDFEEKFYLAGLGLTLKDRVGCPAPLAIAGKDLKVNEGSKIKLDASGSRGLYDEEVSYIWKQISGPSGILSKSHSQNPEFKAPQVDKNTNLKFELTVKSSRGLSSTDSATVTVNNVIDEPNEKMPAEGGDEIQGVKFGTKGFNIAAIGDWGCNSNTQASANNIARSSPELVLALGDYSYSNTARCWLDIIEPMDSVTRITIGNHEDQASEDSGAYLNHFGLSKKYYSYDYQDIHVLTLNSEENYAVGSSQFNFVKNDLQIASNNPNIRWKIVTIHEPAYSSPNSCSSCKAADSLSDTYHPLFDQYHVDLVLEGHVHNYQRSYPLSYNINDPSKPIITDHSKNNYLDPKGAVFAVVGTGGINFHSLAGKATYISNQQDIKFGFLNIYFSDDGKTLFASFIANDGSTLDEFSITKSTAKIQSIGAPRAENGRVTLLENSISRITMNASNIVDPRVKYLIESGPMHGTLSGKTATVTYKPSRDYVGQDSFTFKAIDDKGSESNIATVTLDVKAVDQAPVAEDQSISVDKNKLLDMTLVATDGEGSPVEFALESQPTSGELGNFDANQGTVTYKPSRDYVGQDSFTFKAIDDKGSESNFATVTIDVKAVDQAPVADPETGQEAGEDVTPNLNESNSTGPGTVMDQQEIENQESNPQQFVFPGILNSEQRSFDSLKEFESINPKLLSAELRQKDPERVHKLLLKSYVNDGVAMNMPDSTYPNRPSLTLQRGTPISVVSTNPEITFTGTTMILYDKHDLPVYPTRRDTDTWLLDVPLGLYKLEVKTEYSPTNRDTVSFIDTIRIKKGSTVNMEELIDKKLSDIENLFG
jgi:hypothetical protein